MGLFRRQSAGTPGKLWPGYNHVSPRSSCRMRSCRIYVTKKQWVNYGCGVRCSGAVNASSVLVTETAVDGWECDDVMTLCGDDQYFDVVVNSCSSCSSVCRPQLQQQRDYCLQNCPRESASTVLQRLLYASDLSWLYRFRYTVNGDFGRENAVFRRDSIK